MELAFELALRGAHVITTMHAGSAVHAVQRLIEWGLDPFIVATNLGAVLNVRLLRRLCPSCRQRVTAEDGQNVWPRNVFGRPLPESGFAKSPEGCATCRHTGTVGQFTIAELLGLEGTTVEQIRDSTGIAELMAGRRTLPDEAARVLSEGATDLTAVLRAHIGVGSTSKTAKELVEPAP
jgi:general secretion pathway protein E